MASKTVTLTEEKSRDSLSDVSLSLKRPEGAGFLTNVLANTPKTSANMITSATEAGCIKSEKCPSTGVSQKKNKNLEPKKSKSALALEEVNSNNSEDSAVAEKMIGLRIEDETERQMCHDLDTDCEATMPGQNTESSLLQKDAAASATSSDETHDGETCSELEMDLDIPPNRDNITVPHTGVTPIPSTSAVGTIGQSSNESIAVSGLTPQPSSVITAATSETTKVTLNSADQTTWLTSHSSNILTSSTSHSTSVVTVDVPHTETWTPPSSTNIVMEASMKSTNTVIEAHEMRKSNIVPTGATSKPSSTATLTEASFDTDSPMPISTCVPASLLGSKNSDSGSWSMQKSSSNEPTPDMPPSTEASEMSQQPSTMKDILLLHTDDDEEDAILYKKHLEEEVGLPQDLTVDLFSGIDPGKSTFASMDSVPERYKLVLLYMTRTFVENGCTEFLHDMILTHKVSQNEKIFPVQVHVTKEMAAVKLKLQYKVTKPLKYYNFLSDSPQMKQHYLNSLKQLVAHKRTHVQTQ